jgi:hypothetical protein
LYPAAVAALAIATGVALRPPLQLTAPPAPPNGAARGLGAHLSQRDYGRILHVPFGPTITVVA